MTFLRLPYIHALRSRPSTPDPRLAAWAGNHCIDEPGSIAFVLLSGNRRSGGSSRRSRGSVPAGVPAHPARPIKSPVGVGHGRRGMTAKRRASNARPLHGCIKVAGEDSGSSPLDKPLQTERKYVPDSGHEPTQIELERFCKTFAEVGRAILMRRRAAP